MAVDCSGQKSNLRSDYGSPFVQVCLWSVSRFLSQYPASRVCDKDRGGFASGIHFGLLSRGGVQACRPAIFGGYNINTYMHVNGVCGGGLVRGGWASDVL